MQVRVNDAGVVHPSQEATENHRQPLTDLALKLLISVPLSRGTKPATHGRVKQADGQIAGGPDFEVPAGVFGSVDLNGQEIDKEITRRCEEGKEAAKRPKRHE